MNIVFGFGQQHLSITRAFCDRLAQEVPAQDESPKAEARVRAKAEELALQEGTFKKVGWRVARIKRVSTNAVYPGATACVVEGTYSHFRDDHPMSPDGVACFDVPWCVVVLNDETWGRRVYVSI